MTARVTQLEALLRWLQSGASITPVEALGAFNCFRLGGRIYDLKARGYEIETRMVTVPSGARVASYRLIAEPAQLPLVAS